MSEEEAANALLGIGRVPTEQRRDGVVQFYEVKQTHRKDGKGLLKNPKLSTMYRPHCAQPTIGPRKLDLIEGPRHERRPSALAKKGGKRRAIELGWADEY